MSTISVFNLDHTPTILLTVEAIANRAVARGEAPVVEPVRELDGSILRPVIRVMNERLFVMCCLVGVLIDVCRVVGSHSLD